MIRIIDYRHSPKFYRILMFMLIVLLQHSSCNNYNPEHIQIKKRAWSFDTDSETGPGIGLLTSAITTVRTTKSFTSKAEIKTEKNTQSITKLTTPTTSTATIKIYNNTTTVPSITTTEDLEITSTDSFISTNSKSEENTLSTTKLAVSTTKKDTTTAPSFTSTEDMKTFTDFSISTNSKSVTDISDDLMVDQRSSSTTIDINRSSFSTAPINRVPTIASGSRSCIFRGPFDFLFLLILSSITIFQHQFTIYLQ